MLPRIGSTRDLALAVALVGVVGAVALAVAGAYPAVPGDRAARVADGTAPAGAIGTPPVEASAAMVGSATPTPTPTPAPPSAVSEPTGARSVVPPVRSSAVSEPTTGASAAPSSAPAARIPLVPIVGFWSADRSITTARLAAVLAGTDRQFGGVVVAGPDLAPLTASLGVVPGSKVSSTSAAAVFDAVRGSTDVIGFVRADDVEPSVRALAVDGRSLFGNGRVRSTAEWPLAISPSSTDAGSGIATTFDAATTWTLVAAGDVMNDREVYRRTVLLGAGPDFPWDGGTARIVSRTCCRLGLTIVRAERTGHAGAVRALFRDADVSLINHEGPAPDRHTYHPSGLVFTFDPALEAGIANAGVDIASLANNHIRNAGSDGVLETIRAIRDAGMTPLGAGEDAETARRPVARTVGGVRVAFLAYDAINLAGAGATTRRAGAAPFDLERIGADIRAARKAGAQVVVVVPHWGVEYTDRPTLAQRRQAAALVAAGADVILGSHPHWAGAIESIDDGVVLYSLGDFIFDLPRSEHTEEGLIAELTFVGARLAQVELHPTVQLDRSQPNLLEAEDARVVLDRVRAASGDRLGW